MMLKKPNLSQRIQRGFTLVEIAVVLAIAGLVIGGLLATLTAQVEQKNLNETRETIENVKEALVGYAMANGRFPCPAVAPAGGVTAVEVGSSATGNCTNFFNGYVPAVTLGLSPIDTSGYVLDGWDNPIRYAISNLPDNSGTTNVFTQSAGMKNANATTCSPNCGMAWIAGRPSLLYICSTGAGIAAGACSSADKTLTKDAVLVVYSTGKNTATGGVGVDEAANLNGDTAFVSHTPNSGANEFDDIVEWISASSVFGRLVQANQLP